MRREAEGGGIRSARAQRDGALEGTGGEKGSGETGGLEGGGNERSPLEDSRGIEGASQDLRDDTQLGLTLGDGTASEDDKDGSVKDLSTHDGGRLVAGARGSFALR